jgi:general stress protein 26
MMPGLKALILRLLDEHRVMTIATNRPDGWPQATIVGYVNDGYLLYCFVARNTQKYVNILRDPRISIAIGSDAPNPKDIKGLSLAGRACEVTDRSEFDDISKLRLKRYPEYSALPQPTSGEDALVRISPQPSPASIVLLRIAPEIISVLDYSKGFGHSDLVTFSERDLDVHIRSLRHHWNGNTEADPSANDVSAKPDSGRT